MLDTVLVVYVLERFPLLYNTCRGTVTLFVYWIWKDSDVTLYTFVIELRVPFGQIRSAESGIIG